MAGGFVSIDVTGQPVRTSNERVALGAPRLPAASFASATAWCAPSPSARPASKAGEVQAANGCASRLHSNVLSGCVEVMVKDANGSAVTDGGPPETPVSGSVVRTENVRSADAEEKLPAASSARAEAV